MVCSSSAVAELQLLMKLTVEAHCSTDVTQGAQSVTPAVDFQEVPFIILETRYIAF